MIAIVAQVAHAKGMMTFDIWKSYWGQSVCSKKLNNCLFIISSAASLCSLCITEAADSSVLIYWNTDQHYEGMHGWTTELSDLNTFITLIIESTFTNHYFIMITILFLIFQSSCSPCRWYLNISIKSAFIQISHWIVSVLSDSWMNNNSVFETGCWEHSSTSLLEFHIGRKKEMIDSSQWLNISSCIRRRSSEDRLLCLQSRLTQLKSETAEE